MITKLVLNTAFDFGEISARSLPISRSGVDWQAQRKIAGDAGIFARELANLKPIPNHTVMHIIALGDEERFGPNRNADAFSRQDNIENHHTFVDLGHVFKHHKHSSPELAVGHTIASAHNPEPGRVELLLAFDNNKCPQEAQAAANGEDIPFSMGSSQQYDVCSICDHQAPTADDHCDHIKHFLGQVLADGRKVYMKNPKPKYFDISIVHKPADRIAYGLRKVASTATVKGGHELAAEMGVRGWTSPKTAMAKKLADIIKRIPAGGKAVPKPLSQPTATELKKVAAAYGVDHLLAFLHANGLMLSDVDFVKIIVGTTGGCEQSEGLDDVLADDTDVTSMDGAGNVEHIPLEDSVLGEMYEKCSMTGQAPSRRVMKMAMAPSIKVASTALSSPMGLLYKYYKLAFAVKNPQAAVAVASTF